MKEHADDQGCPLILSEGDGKGYTVDIVFSISKPMHLHSYDLVQDSMWINDLVSPLADSHGQPLGRSYNEA